MILRYEASIRPAGYSASTQDERRFGASALRLQGAAAGLLGWLPAEFWEATPAELAGALGLGEADAPADRATLSELLERFPDEGVS